MPKYVKRCDHPDAGSLEGHTAHKRAGEKSCEDCRVAYNFYIKMYRLLTGRTTSVNLDREQLTHMFSLVWDRAKMEDINPYREQDAWVAVEGIIVGGV